jgi:hypothetical protein
MVLFYYEGIFLNIAERVEMFPRMLLLSRCWPWVGVGSFVLVVVGGGRDGYAASMGSCDMLGLVWMLINPPNHSNTHGLR